MDPTLIHVLIPDEFGALLVVPVIELFELLAGDEYDTMGDLLDNAGIDSIDIPTSYNRVTPEMFAEKIAKVRALNLTGDGRAYWDLDKETDAT